MNTINLLKAVGQVNESYITALLEEKPSHSRSLRRRRFRVAAAACLCLIIGSLIYMHTKENPASLPFAITVYSKDQEGNVVGELLKKVRIPISVFYSDKGQPIFVLSVPTINSNALFADHHSLDFRVNSYPVYDAEARKEITGIEELPGNVYFYYLPDQRDLLPYEFFFPLGNPDGNSYELYAYFRITQTDGQYYVELLEIKTVKVNNFTDSIYNDNDQIPGEWNMDTHH